MRRLIFILALVLVSACSYAQTFNWQEMNKPYFVYDAKGISVGWDVNTQYSYLIASDLTNNRIHCSLTTGAENWPPNTRREIKPGASRVCASRSSGGYAAAIVPIGNPNNPNPQYGVHFTNNGGVSWTYNPDNQYDPPEQPPSVNLSCIAVHPTNPNLCYAGAFEQPEYWAAHWTLWRTTNRGQSWDLAFPWNRTNVRVYSARFLDCAGVTFIWTCFQDSGLCYFNSNENRWHKTMPPYGYAVPYDALDIAVCGTGGFNHYYQLANYNGIYKLWIGDTETWTEVKNFGTNSQFAIVRLQMNLDNLYFKLRDTFSISKLF